MAVFIGGGFGSLARLGVNKAMSGISALIPYGTLSSNFLSCLIVGLTVVLIEEKILISPVIKTFVLVGFCGGFSTFSAFIREIFFFTQQNKAGPMIAYALLSIVLGLVGLISGIWLGKLCIK